VHVSTSYCHLDEKVLFEKAYPPPTDPHKIIQSMEMLDEPFVETISKEWVFVTNDLITASRIDNH